MPAPLSVDLQATFQNAAAQAYSARRPVGSHDLLIELLQFMNPAAALLGQLGVDEDDVYDALGQLDPLEPEPTGTTGYLRTRSQTMALADGSRTTGVLHLLGCVAALSNCAAHRILVTAGIDMARLRRQVVEWIALDRAGRLPTGLAQRTARAVRRQESGSAAPVGAPPQPIERPPGGRRTAGASPAQPAETAPASAQPSTPAQRPAVRAQPSVPARPPRADVAPAQTAGAAAGQRDNGQGAGARWALTESETPTLCALGRNLTVMAAEGRIDPLVGRERELEEVIDILHKRRANNPCLIGEPGVGKTAIAEGLALRIATGAVPESMADRVVVGLDVGSLVSGTQMRGSFNERMALLKREVAAADGRVIVFIDEIHTMLGAGASGEGVLDAAAELKTALAHGSFPCLGATTTEEYRRYIEEDPALVRRFQPVVVEEPSAEVALEILRGLAPRYEAHHRVTYTEEALESSVKLASRYITERFLPDKSISLLDLAGARARRRGLSEVGHPQIAEVVARTTSIPLEKLLLTESERFLHMEDELGRQVIGHQRVLARVCQTIRRNYAGFSSDRPIGSFLFLGPTGVGKTETVKVLADFLFQSRDALTRLDMSEYMEPHSVARMIGSPPGYVGHEEGGQLTEAVRRRPYQIVLLDEVEKAHRDVLNVLLQVLDEGKLTDGRGRSVDFRNTVVVMTSNLGSQHYGRTRRSIGFGAAAPTLDDQDDELSARVRDTAKGAFPVELWNRIEERLVFAPLREEEVAAVAVLQLADSSRRLGAERGIRFEAGADAVQYLVSHGGYNRELGARPMRQTIQRLIEGPIAEQILAGQVRRGDRLRITVDAETGRLAIDRLAAPE